MRVRESLSWKRLAIAVAWLAVVGVAIFLALDTRTDRADVKGSAAPAMLVLTVPAVIVALFAIRSTVIFALTAGVACAFGAWQGTSVMNDWHSTAAVGVIA